MGGCSSRKPAETHTPRESERAQSANGTYRPSRVESGAVVQSCCHSGYANQDFQPSTAPDRYTQLVVYLWDGVFQVPFARVLRCPAFAARRPHYTLHNAERSSRGIGTFASTSELVV